jgi:hypothetical protein
MRRLPFQLAVLFCWLLASGAVVTAVGAFRFLKVAQPATGRVVALREHTSSDGSTYSPTIEFADPTGRIHVIESGLSASPPAYRVGEAVRVLYPPDRPTDGKLDHPVELWAAPLVLGVLSLGLGLFGGFLRMRELAVDRRR